MRKNGATLKAKTKTGIKTRTLLGMRVPSSTTKTEAENELWLPSLLFAKDFCILITVEQIILYICAVGGLTGIAAVLTVFVNHAKYKRDNYLKALTVQIQSMQADSKNQNEALCLLRN